MPTNDYDVIVIGGRVAGSPTAMLLARAGHRVLLVDRDTFPSDTMSTHLIHPPALAALDRWGLLERVEAAGPPPLTEFNFDVGGPVITAGPGASDGIARGSGIRRYVLDTILVGAAQESGVEVRTGIAVSGLLFDEGRVVGITGIDATAHPFEARARIVIGADGMNSRVARVMEPEQYHLRPAVAAAYYTYWSGIPFSGFTAFVRDRLLIGVMETNDRKTQIFVQIPNDDFFEFRKDVEGNYLAALQSVPEVAALIEGAVREERIMGFGNRQSFFRKPYGDGWALVGDAGYVKDPTFGHGIMDAFIQAEMLAERVDAGLKGERDMSEALADYQVERDQKFLGIYEFIMQAADLANPSPGMEAAIGLALQDQVVADALVGVVCGTVPVEQFFGMIAEKTELLAA